ncbi:MAG: Cell division protein ftsA [Parcubacteria group bacterium Gr01-1014_107]|nr:MAG: Cell division protein ftsA [Parcubacteria group bacterium Gr01-1014_107]
MAAYVSAGIDIGTQNIRVGVALGVVPGEYPLPKMLGFGTAESKGLRQGCVVERKEVLKNVLQAVRSLEKNTGIRIKNVSLAAGGIGLESFFSSAETVVSRADLEVTELDINKLKDACEKNIPSNILLNKRILHVIPILYKLDSKTVLGDPVGMKGAKLEVRCLFISIMEKYLDELIEIIEEGGIETVDVVASPLAASLVLLSKQQKKAGCALVDIGAETVSVIVFENNTPISLEVFPTGGNHITNDIALGLKISLEEAEHIKTGGLTAASYPRKKLDEIIEARLSDIFDMIDGHLKKINRSGLLPAGVIFSGGGSNVSGIDELARSYLKLPAKVASIQKNEQGALKSNHITIKDAAWAPVYGVCLLGSNVSAEEGRIYHVAQKAGRRIKRILKQFLP